MSPPYLGESCLGDYDEMFDLKVSQLGKIKAVIWYWQQALQASALSAFWSGIMLKSYMKITWRNVKRHKIFSLINISGLALGVACCILILLWVQDELSWNKFHAHYNEIFIVVQQQPNGHLTPVTPDALAGYLKNEYPEVINAARYKYLPNLQLEYDGKIFSETPLAADPNFFQVFSFPFVRGELDLAMQNPRSLILTQTAAFKLFGDEDPIGKIVTANNRTPLEVTGILQNIPRNSSFKFSCALPFFMVTGEKTENNWTSNSSWTYIQLKKNTAYQNLDQKISGLVSERDPDNNAQLSLRPLRMVHLNPQANGGPILYIYIFSAMAIFVLLIACINFINLTTAQSSLRAREVGLRKVVGAKRANLVKQFFGESLLSTLAAVLAGILLVVLLMPAFNNLSGKEFTIGPDLFGNKNLLLGIIGIFLLTAFLAGSYPALLLASFKPVKVLRSTKDIPGSNRSPYMRRILVIIQYSIAIFLMIGTFIIHRQLSFIKNIDLGFDQNLMVCSDSSWGKQENYRILKNELLKHPNIHNIAFTSQQMGAWESGARDDVIWEGKKGTPKLTFEVIFCDPDFLTAHKMELVQGRFFSADIQSDIRESFVLNEAAVRAMEFGDESPVGKSLTFWDSYRGTIIGVIKDYHTQSLHNRIQPVILAYNPDFWDVINIRISAQDMPGTLGFLTDKWKELSSGMLFEYWFMNESLDQRYRAEQATGTLLKYFTFFAIFISCLGLLGLIAFITRQRTKEVGIRKVLGATVPNILQLLIKESVLLVLLANVLAWPVAYLMVKNWLENFAYRTDIAPYIFFLSGGIAVIIALAAVSMQAFKAANANPIDSLRYE